jgi:hypothetical protein
MKNKILKNNEHLKEHSISSPIFISDKTKRQKQKNTFLA